MRSIRTTNNAHRRAMRRRIRRAVGVRLVLLSLRIDDDDQDEDDCGQCLGTGTIEGGLGGDGADEECPVCDGAVVLPKVR